MGNGHSTSLPAPLQARTGASPSTGDTLLGELGGQVIYEKSLGTSRFLKTIRARHKEGALVIKVFVKSDPTVSLKAFHRRVKAEREALQDCPNVLAFQRVLETERSGYLMRQWVASNLYDRISTRPFLTSVEKRWLAYQLLLALSTCHSLGISHGDIKTENILVTSSLTLYVTDFSSAYKPTYLPLDDPSIFSYFFDTSQRRTCYLAPERFFEQGSEVGKRKEGLGWGKKDGKVTEAMDVFAAGCVLAELWMEGTPVFTLSQMLKFREGAYDPEAYLNEIEDVEIRTMIKSMLSISPSSRQPFASYLTEYRGTAFPSMFYEYLHPFVVSLPTTVTHAPSPATQVPAVGEPALKTVSDEILESIASEWETIVGYLNEEDGPFKTGSEAEDRRPEAAESSHAGSLAGKKVGLFPVKLHIPGVEAELKKDSNGEDGPSLLILSLILSNIRNCLRPATVIRTLDILLALCAYLTDEMILDRLLPYLVVLLEDDIAAVRTAAIRTLTQSLLLVKTITPSNASLFTEYIFPNTKQLTADSEILPRMTYASCIAELAKCAKRFLEMKEGMKAEGRFRSREIEGAHEFDGGAEEADNYDTSLLELHATIQDHLTPLLTDPSSVVKRALLSSIATLCTFFGRVKANDAVLAHLVTYLNTRDWLLRAEWNQHAVEVATVVGPHSLEEYILPLITLSLSDSEEFVTVKVLEALTMLAERRMLAKGKVWELVVQTTGFLCHPNIWIREGTAAFLTCIANSLQPTDRWCILYPTIKRLLRADIKDITELAVLDNAREPLSRVIFEAAVAWAGKSSKSQFWSPVRAPTKGAPREASIRTDEDHNQLEKLRQLGMKPEDEYKINMMREYISKLATARQASPPSLNDSSESLAQSGGVALQELGIIPQTIIFRIRTAAEIADGARDAQLRIPDYPRRFSTDTPHSPSSVTGTNRHVSGQQPIEDLRRRLALVGAGASSTSLAGSQHSPGIETPASPAPNRRVSAADGPSLERTVSYSSNDELSESAASVRTTDVAPTRTRSRVHLNAVEVGRVTPAVGQDSTNVMGFFNVDTRYKDDDAMSGTNAVSAFPHAVSKAASPAPTPAMRFVSTYEGNDPRIKQLVERGFLDNFREPVPELGPHVPVGIPRSRALRTSFLPRERRPTRPDGKLIAHLVEHKAAITSIQVSPDQLFFATGSEDGTVKIWDTIRLEKNVTSKSRHTYQQGGKIVSVCILENSHCVASASDNGTLWIHRVDISLSGAMPKYGKQHLIRQRSMDEAGDFVTCMASFDTPTTTNLILGTSLSSIIVLDVRTMRSLHEFANPRHFGPITCLCVDPNHVWLVVGTAGGTMTLWDLRFGLLLRSWTVGKRRVHQAALHPSKGKGRWIIVAVEDEIVEDEVSKRNGALVAEVWDIDKGLKVEEFRVIAAGAGQASTASRSAGVISGGEPASAMQESTLNPAAAIEALLAAPTPQVKPRVRLLSPAAGGTSAHMAVRPGVRTFLAGVDYSLQHDQRFTHSTMPEAEAESTRGVGYLITAGEDRKVRFWDLDRVDRSMIVSGLDLEEDRPGFTAHTSTTRPSLYLESPAPAPSRSRPSTSTSKVHRSTLIANSQHQILAGHQDTVTALAVIDLPFRCVVSGDRSGTLKVFD